MISNKIKEIVKQRKNSIERDIVFMESMKGKRFRDNRKSLSEVIKDNSEPSIISEIKLASPSLGEIRESYNLESIIMEMVSSGVVGLSVLTEP
jgi:indole-3-glycerol phosphate synthase